MKLAVIQIDHIGIYEQGKLIHRWFSYEEYIEYMTELCNEDREEDDEI
ncbi:MAG: hypothetical protein IKA83_02445 [Paludibacteraceae bacterium]|nr:hypothetical protein [Paludibacteraceae bacterium]